VDACEAVRPWGESENASIEERFEGGKPSGGSKNGLIEERSKDAKPSAELKNASPIEKKPNNALSQLLHHTRASTVMSHVLVQRYYDSTGTFVPSRYTWKSV